MNKSCKALLGVLAFLILWQFVSMVGLFNPIFFASPIEVFQEAQQMLQSASIYLDSWTTLYRVIISIFVSIIVGVPIGIMLGYFAHVYPYVSEIVDFLRSIPPIVIYPLLLISLGPGDSSRIATAVLGSIAVIILIVSRGLFQQDITRQKFYQARGASTIQIIKEIVWFESLPHIMTALRTASSISLIVIVVTEMLVGGKYGLGARVQQVQITSNIPDLFFTIILIGLIGIIFNKILIWIDKKLIFWKTM